MQQGKLRLERGSNFYKTAKNLASEKSWVFNWEIDTVGNVGHDYRKMSSQAVNYIAN